MMGTLIAKFLKGRWGAILPALLKAIAEGKAGEPAKAIYWKTVGYKTPAGALVFGVGAGLGYVCGSYHDVYPWACTAQTWLMGAGGLLVSVGLVDGGTRAEPPVEPKG
jgi:uncharacterized membrane protein YedE/YeeE